MIGLKEVEDLKAFRGEDLLVTSLYLNIDGNCLTPSELALYLKELLKKKKEELSNSTYAKEIKVSAEKDLAKIARFIEVSLDRKKKKGVAIFSCDKKEFWQEYYLPVPVKSRLVLNRKPYVTPLLRLLSKYHRFCLIIVDKSLARIFEIFLGEIIEYSEIFHAVPGKVRQGGWHGYAERHIERHIDDHVHQHLKEVADLGLQFFKKNSFDWLILGGQKENIMQLEALLHPHLKEKLVERITIDIETPSPQVLEYVLKIEEKIQGEHEDRIVKKLSEEVEKGGYGVWGVSDTILAFMQGQVHTLVVKEDTEIEGFICTDCKYLTLKKGNCPLCTRGLEKSEEFVDALIARAMDQNCKVEYITKSELLEKQGGVGALLRFRI